MKLSRLHVHLRQVAEDLRTSYWFVPSCMTAGSILLALGVQAVERRYDPEVPDYLLLAGAEGARAVLATIAGSMITVAGVSFSIVLVAITQATSLFGPRLVPSFLRDRGNQISLGTFVATFVYCILLLLRIRGGDDSSVPRLGVAIAVLLALASIAVLIYFLHHAAASLRVGRILQLEAHELVRSIRHVFAEAGEGDEEPPAADPSGLSVTADRAGFVGGIEEAELIAVARRAGGRVRMAVRAGAWVLPGAELARIEPLPADGDEAARRVRSAVVLENDRGSVEDVLHHVERLVEIAVRSLSPGINDPLTAAHAVDRLAAAIVELGARGTAPQVRRDDDGKVRLVLRPLPVAKVVDRAFDGVRIHGARTRLVPLRQLSAIAALAAVVERPEIRRALRRQADLVLEAALPHQATSADRNEIESRHRRALDALAGAVSDAS